MTGDELRVQLLGEVRASRGGLPTPVGGVQRLSLLALLALRAPRSVSRADIVDALWPEDPPASAVNAIQVHASALRRVLGAEAIRTAGDGYRLGTDVGVDAAEFAALGRRGAAELAQDQASTAAATLRAALALWRGPALAGLDEVLALAPDRHRLEEARLIALERRLEADVRRGAHREVVAELESLVARHPLREGLRVLLMQAMSRSGRQAEALAVFDVGRRLLRDELGLDPSPALRGMHERVLEQSDAAPVHPDVLVATRRGLPALLDETVGREPEFATLEELLTVPHGRLLTVLGTGGVGKTRLAVAFGHREAAAGRAVVFVPLSDADTPADVLAVMCKAAGVRAGGSAEAALVVALQAPGTLLVCDNFEHVLAAADVVSRLLAGALDLRVLTTTRQPLGIPGERVLTLQPLETVVSHPRALGPAARLLMARVRDHDPTFAPAAADRADLAEIAHRCEGLPLALELAAARTRVLTLAEVRRRLADPLSLLAGGAAGVPVRHRTLRASIAWSVEALTPDLAEFLAQLTAFRGGFTLAAAAAVTGSDPETALDDIAALLDRCLVQRMPAGEGLRRFSMLESIAEYMAERLGPPDLAGLRRRHAEHFREWLRPPPEPTRAGASLSTWRELFAEQSNLRQAVRWALGEDDGELAADLVIGTAPLWDQSGPAAELEEWLQRMLARDDVAAGRRCDALWWQATLASGGDPRAMQAPLDEARAIAEADRDTRRLVWIDVLGEVAVVLAERPDDAVRAVRSGQELAATNPGGANFHVALLMLNGQLAATGAVAAAQALLARQHEVARGGGRSLELRVLLVAYLVELSINRADPHRAKEFAEEGLRLAEVMGSDLGRADGRSQRGVARLMADDASGAVDDLRAALHGHLRLGLVSLATRDLLRLAAVAAVGHPEVAASAVGVARAAHPSRDWTPEPPVATRLEALAGRPEEETLAGAAMVDELGSRAALTAASNAVAALYTSG